MVDINKFFDDGSFVEIAKKVSLNCITGYATVDKRLVYLICETGKFIDDNATKKIEKIYELAIETGAPVVYIIDNNGIDIKGAYPLSLYGRIFKMQNLAKNKIIQIAIVSGNAMSGSSVIAQNCDFVFVNKTNAKMWTVLPVSVNENTDDEQSKLKNLGKSFLADAVLDEDKIGEKIRQIVYYLPSNCEDNDTYVDCNDDLNRKIASFTNIKNDELVKQIADDNKDFEIKSEFAKSMYTGFIKLNGQTVGVMANRSEEKTVCKNQLKKINKFLNFLNNFSIPLLSVVDAKRFKIDKNEDQDISLDISNFVNTYVNAKIPKVVLIRNAEGFCGFVMGSKGLGADLVFAYEDSQIKFMDEENLAKILYEDDINNSNDKKKLLDEKTEEIKNDYNIERAQKEYVIDDIIEKERTRQIIISAFEILWTKKI